MCLECFFDLPMQRACPKRDWSLQVAFSRRTMHRCSDGRMNTALAALMHCSSDKGHNRSKDQISFLRAFIQTDDVMFVRPRKKGRLMLLWQRQSKDIKTLHKIPQNQVETWFLFTNSMWALKRTVNRLLKNQACGLMSKELYATNEMALSLFRNLFYNI